MLIIVIYDYKIKRIIKLPIYMNTASSQDNIRTNNTSAKTAVENVLIVDDSPTDNFINERLIRYYKFSNKVVSKTSGFEALSYLRDNQDSLDNLPDIIFLDINMPVMNGFGFVGEFEKLPESITNKTKIVILSSSENPRDIAKIQNHESVIHYISKPLSEESLAKVDSMITSFYQ